MSRKERDRITIMVGIRRSELTLRVAARVLDLSDRQTRRVWRRYQAQGDAGLVHRAQGRPGPRRAPPALRARILARYRERYGDVGPTLAAEYLRWLRLVLRTQPRSGPGPDSERGGVRQHQPQHRRHCERGPAARSTRPSSFSGFGRLAVFPASKAGQSRARVRL